MREFDRLRPAPDPDRVSAEERADYESVAARVERVDYGRYDTPARYYGALLNSPPLAAAITRLGTFVRQGQLRGSYTDADRELVDIVLGTDLGYNGIFTVHIPDAFAVGVRPDAIDAIRGGNETDLTADERQIVDYTRASVSGKVTDALFASLVERMGERGAIEFTTFINFLLMTIRNWQALGVPDPTDAEIDELIVGLRNGDIPIPGAHERIA